MSETDIDELSTARELDTVPKGLAPPPSFVGEPPVDIPGAPEWANALFREIRVGTEESRATRKELGRLIRNVELLKQQFSSFRAETRGRFTSHEIELEEMRMRLNDNQDEHFIFREQLDRATLRIAELEAELRAARDDGR